MTNPHSRKVPAIAMSAMLLAIALLFTSTASADDWAQFRGAGGTSAADANIPVKISPENGMAWKLEMPGKGASSPIVIGDKVIVTCSGGPKQDQLYTVCVDAKTGKQLWEQKFWATGRCLCHELSANAAPTPASDGKHVYAFFSSNDLACMDMDGNLVWYRGLGVDHPKAGNDVGMSSSVVVHDGILVAQVECAQDSFAIGIDAETGSTIWEIERTKDSNWASPLLITGKDQPSMVVLQSVDKVTVNDLKTGKELHSLEGKCSSISSSAFVNGVLFVPINGTTAIGVNGTNFETLWTGSKISPSSMSTVVHKDKLFTLNRAAVLSAFNTSDGSEAGQARVGGR